MKFWKFCIAAGGLLAGLQGTLHAQLLIGQTVGVTGSAAATVKESMGGAQLYFYAVKRTHLPTFLFEHSS